jgi:hypothetical protein
MKYRLLEHEGEIYLVVGFGYDLTYDPPEVFHCVKLKDSLFKSLMVPYEIVIPLSEAIEITDKKRMLAILALYGD